MLICFFLFIGDGLMASVKFYHFVPTTPLRVPKVIPHRSCENFVGSALINISDIFSLIIDP